MLLTQLLCWRGGWGKSVVRNFCTTPVGLGQCTDIYQPLHTIVGTGRWVSNLLWPKLGRIVPSVFYTLQMIVEKRLACVILPECEVTICEWVKPAHTEMAGRGFGPSQLFQVETPMTEPMTCVQTIGFAAKLCPFQNAWPLFGRERSQRTAKQPKQTAQFWGTCYKVNCHRSGSHFYPHTWRWQWCRRKREGRKGLRIRHWLFCINTSDDIAHHWQVFLCQVVL